MQTLRVAVLVGIGMLGSVSVANAQKATPKKAATTKAVAGPDGGRIFTNTCAVCHQPDGAGKEGMWPPLDGSEWVTGNEAKLVRIIIHGLTGPVEVAGETYTSAMPGWGGVLEDGDIAAVATYIRSSWGNKAAPITTAKVTAIRAATKSRNEPWTVPELAQVKDE